MPLISLLFIVFMVPLTAHAYIDPAQGGFFFQMVVATFLGGLVTLKFQWKRLRQGFKPLIQELGQLYRFARIPTKARSIIFYTEKRGYYPFFEGMIKKLIEKHSQSIAYVTSDPEDPIRKDSHEKIHSIYLDKLLPLFFRFVRCRVLVMTLTDLHQFHLKRSIFPIHYVYVFHSLASTHMAFRSGSFDHYDSILCPGPQHFQEIRKYEEMMGLKKKHLIPAGDYRLEALFHEYTAYTKNGGGEKGGGATILIAPSWGEENILETCGHELISKLLDANFSIIVRPHSETKKRNADLMDNLKKSFSSHPRFKMEMLSHTHEALLKSDVLISDYSGIALSYAFATGRPVLFIDVPKKMKNPDYEKLEIEPLELTLRSEIGAAVSPQELDKVPETLSRLIGETETFKKKNFKLRDEYIYSFGNASDVSSQHIMSLVNRLH
jgi:hypothetical protein